MPQLDDTPCVSRFIDPQRCSRRSLTVLLCALTDAMQVHSQSRGPSKFLTFFAPMAGAAEGEQWPGLQRISGMVALQADAELSLLC